MKQFLFAAILLLLAVAPCTAQPISADDIKSQMVKDWERAKAYTVDYLNTMPADKYNFKPTDSIRTFAQQMLHLAQANLFLMSNATDVAAPDFGSNLEQRPSAQSKDSVMYYINASYDYSLNALKASDLANWGQKKKLFSFEETRFAMLLKAFEHQTHHRGQTTIYIRLQGVKPPNERLF